MAPPLADTRAGAEQTSSSWMKSGGVDPSKITTLDGGNKPDVGNPSNNASATTASANGGDGMQRVNGGDAVAVSVKPTARGDAGDGENNPSNTAYFPAVQGGSQGDSRNKKQQQNEGQNSSKGEAAPSASTGNGANKNGNGGGEAAAGTQARNNNAPEPGWMRSLYLGESGSRFSLPTVAKRHLVPWIPVALRVIQIVFTVVAFAVVASMSHPDAMCRQMSPAVATDDPNAPAGGPLGVLVENALCLPGRDFTDFVALEFFVVVTAAAFAWACLFFILDMVRGRRGTCVCVRCACSHTCFQICSTSTTHEIVGRILTRLATSYMVCPRVADCTARWARATCISSA